MDKVYRIWIVKSEEDLAKEVRLQTTFKGNKYPVYTYDFWKNIVISEYDPYTTFTTFIFYDKFGNIDTKLVFKEYIEVLNFFKKIELNNFLGYSFKSYSAAWLNLIYWAADVAWTKEKWNNLMGKN